MRLLLVFPGALFSTLDVAEGYLRAFRKRQDITTLGFYYHKSLIYHEYSQKFLFGKEFNQDNVIASASDDLLNRILKTRPDWVLFISGIAFPTLTWEYVKQLQQDLKTPFKTAVILTESPFVENWESGILERVNIAFSTDYGIIPEYRKVNENLFYVKHSYDPEVHYRADNPRNGVFMVGTGFPERQRILEQVDWEDSLELYGNWMYMGDSPLQRYLKGSNLKNEQVAQKYRESKIALNIFRTVKWPDSDPKFIEPNSAKSLSPRCYEAMACGAMLLTDWREELDVLPKDSYVLWGDAKELEEKTKWYLAHDEEREHVAENGFNAVQGETFDKRITEILEKLNGTNNLH